MAGKINLKIYFQKGFFECHTISLLELYITGCILQLMTEFVLSSNLALYQTAMTSYLISSWIEKRMTMLESSNFKP